MTPLRLSVTAHHRVTGPIVLTIFRETVATQVLRAAILTDNGMDFTSRLSQGRIGAGTRNGLETELARLQVKLNNGCPGHPQTPGPTAPDLPWRSLPEGNRWTSE